jgi:hypothetical protein
MDTIRTDRIVVVADILRNKQLRPRRLNPVRYSHQRVNPDIRRQKRACRDVIWDLRIHSSLFTLQLEQCTTGTAF